MAARKNPYHTETVLKRIQLAKLVDRLQQNALGTLRYPTGGAGGSKKGETKACEMSPGQIDSTKFLIERLVPKAPAQLELQGQGGGPILCQVKFV